MLDVSSKNLLFVSRTNYSGNWSYSRKCICKATARAFLYGVAFLRTLLLDCVGGVVDGLFFSTFFVNLFGGLCCHCFFADLSVRLFCLLWCWMILEDFSFRTFCLRCCWTDFSDLLFDGLRVR